MTKKKSSTSKKKAAKEEAAEVVEKPRKVYPHKLKVVTLADGTLHQEAYHNDRPTKKVYLPKKADPEDGPEPQDSASQLKYPPPKKDPRFRMKWERFLPSLLTRENFKVAHLDALEILCDLYVEYDELTKILRMEGRTYKSISRTGEMIKMRPEVAQLERVQANIRSYTFQLGLFPKKDHSQDDGDKDSNEWG